MLRDPKKYLHDIIDSSRFLIEFTANRTLEDYKQDRGFHSAVERELQIVGEAVMMLKKLNPQLADKITENNRIIHFRHVLVHGYDILNHELIWNVIENKLPTLLQEAEELLGAG